MEFSLKKFQSGLHSSLLFLISHLGIYFGVASIYILILSTLRTVNFTIALIIILYMLTIFSLLTARIVPGKKNYKIDRIAQIVTLINCYLIVLLQIFYSAGAYYYIAANFALIILYAIIDITISIVKIRKMIYLVLIIILMIFSKSIIFITVPWWYFITTVSVFFILISGFGMSTL